MTIMRAEAAATIFSRSSAPPPPLINRRRGSNSSAPSTVRSSSGVSSSVVRGMPRSCACLAVARDVGTQRKRKPFATSAPTASTKKAAVEPVPRPSCIPSRTSPAAWAAAAFLASSALKAGIFTIQAAGQRPPLASQAGKGRRGAAQVRLPGSPAARSPASTSPAGCDMIGGTFGGRT